MINFPVPKDKEDVFSWAVNFKKMVSEVLSEIIQGTRRLHNIFEIGTKELDESGVGDNKVLVYKAASGKIEYDTVAGSGGGDMYKSTYDTDDNGIVDNSEKLEGSTKAEVQNHNPKAHAASHKTGGSDAIKLDELDTPTDNTNLNATTAHHGLLRKLDNYADHYLNGQGNWSTPSGAGDMLKSVYDADDDGIVTYAENVSDGGTCEATACQIKTTVDRRASYVSAYKALKFDNL